MSWQDAFDEVMVLNLKNGRDKALANRTFDILVGVIKRATRTQTTRNADEEKMPRKASRTKN